MSKANPGCDSLIDQTFQQYFASVGKEVRPTQRRIIRSVLEGHNTLGLMPTGSGKSLCYWIAGKALGGVTLVVFPLTALMDEQAQKLAAHGVKVFTLHSGIDGREQYRELINLYAEREMPDFIFVSPERLATDGFLEFVMQRIRERIKLVVVDEVHCISQWGLDFRPFYKEIPHFLQAVFSNGQQPTTLGLTATLNPQDQVEICRDFHIEPEHVIHHNQLLRREIDIQVVKVPDEDTKDERLWALLGQHRNERVLIYIDRRRGKRSTEELAEEALARGLKAAYFHADMTSPEKLDVIARFRAGELLTVFATSAFGMGIDIANIRGVVHYLLTESAEQYYQQIGRAGRDSQPAWAMLFYSDKNIEVRKKWFIERSFPTEKDVVDAFANLTNNEVGRKTVNYFSEDESTQSGYHYLLRSRIIRPICKAVRSLAVFKPAKGVAVPGFEQLRAATHTGQLIPTTKKTGLPEDEIVREVYGWLASGRLSMTHSPEKCLVIDVMNNNLPGDLLDEILADVADKKAYRMGLFDQFVALLNTYTNTFDFHDKIGEYLGIDKYSRARKFQTLSGEMVRSKSEVIIANILYQSGIPFAYEQPLRAPDGSRHDPDFTIKWNGRTCYWEHLGMLDDEEYLQRWERKELWYIRHFPGQLLTTRETSTLSREVRQLVATTFGVSPKDE